VSITSLLLDASALSKLAGNELAMQPWLAVVAAQQAVMYVSAATLAESVDGTSRDAAVHRVVKAETKCEVVTDAIGYEAGRLRAKAASSRRKPCELTVDALVVATACTLPRPVVILTCDIGDIDLLLGADATGRTRGIRSRRV
jgi:predicted nucleic acid-binding protein